jgi:hypothetical protein
MTRFDLYLVPSTFDGRPSVAWSFNAPAGSRPAEVLLAPDGSVLEDRPHGTVLIVPTPFGLVALSAVDAAEQAEAGGLGLALESEAAGRAAG